MATTPRRCEKKGERERKIKVADFKVDFGASKKKKEEAIYDVRRTERAKNVRVWISLFPLSHVL